MTFFSNGSPIGTASRSLKSIPSPSAIGSILITLHFVVSYYNGLGVTVAYYKALTIGLISIF